jgi:hypothetical protein
MSLPEPKIETWMETSEEVPASPPVSGLAVACTIAGVLSLLAVFHPALVVIPLATLVLAVLAWRQIHQHEPPAIGKKGVQVAVLLAVFSGVEGPTHALALRAWLIRESRVDAERFLALLQASAPQRAFQLTRDPNVRLPVDERADSFLAMAGGDQFLWDAIAKDADARENFEGFVNRPAVRAIMELGKQARLRYYSSPVVQKRFGNYQVHHLYALTWEKDGKRRTIFLVVQLERQHLRNTRGAAWVVTDIFAPVNPERYPL